MNKRITFISVISIILISVIAYTLLSNKTTAEIPSASGYAPTFKDWTVHFSEEMDPTTFSNDTVSVMNGNNQQVSITLNWNIANTELTITPPANGYMIGESYDIRISNHVKTASGERLSKAFTHSFETVADLPKIEDSNQLVTLLKERTKQTGKTLFANESVSMESSNVDAEKSSSEDTAGTSETNVQVAGIDEGDIIKTDGEFIYFARDSDIIITTTDKKKSKVISEIREKDFQPTELYIHNDYLISIGYSFHTIREELDGESKENADIAIYPFHTNQTTAYIYDISNQHNPKKVREVTIEGSLTSSRMTDDHLYLIANEYPPMQLMESKQPEIRPFVKDTAKSEKGKAIDFDNMYFFPDSDDPNYLLLASINLNDLKKEAKVESYLGASDDMYMSKQHLYIAVNKYDEKEKQSSDKSAEISIARPGSANTEIIQFNIDKGDFNYNASTIINGTLINQFAMDESNDTFRVATTKGNMWEEDEPSTNNLYTFDTNLNPLGSVEGLADGERIYSVRFMEDVAYMVTFKQMDPLFVIDLKDPKNPTVSGELKIPGFSNYLHPLDENHVIGFGQNTKVVKNKGSKEPQVRQDGLKISLFDVSDPANPKEKYSEIIGQGGSYTELNNNHKALFKHPDKNLFGFPATLFESKIVHQGDAIYEDQSFVYEGAFLYNITPEKGIKLVDTITHQPNKIDYPEWESEVKRIVSVDDMIYTLSNDQMKVYHIKDRNILQTIELPKQPEL